MSSNKIFLITFFSILILSFVSLITKANINSTPKPTCVKILKVVKLIEISYRSGKVELENGKILEVGQPSKAIKIGSEYCLFSNGEIR
jgi:hypothetical protein